MDRPDKIILKQFLADSIAPNSRIIDVGCGTGWTALFLVKIKPDCSVEGVDINVTKVHQANARFRRAGHARTLHCRRCAAEQLTTHFRRSTYNIAVSCNALHHYKDPVRALRQIRSVLKRDGQLLLAELTPAHGETLDDCPRYSRQKLVSFLERADLRVAKIVQKRPGIILIRAVKNR